MSIPVRVGARIHMAEADKLLADLTLKVHDLRPAFRRIDRDVTGHLRKQFDTRGQHLGTPWPALKPQTVIGRTYKRMASTKARAKALSMVGAGQPLRDTNRLWASITKGTSPDSLRLIDLLRYERGTTHRKNGQPVAAIHNTGTKDGKIPARPMIPDTWPAPVIATWEGILVQYITQGTL